MAYTGRETQDGGQTPGPFEEMRRRMAGLDAENDAQLTGKKKRKRREKRRHWVWTIGTNEEDSEGGEQTLLSASKYETPPPSGRAEPVTQITPEQFNSEESKTPIPEVEITREAVAPKIQLDSNMNMT